MFTPLPLLHRHLHQLFCQLGERLFLFDGDAGSSLLELDQSSAKPFFLVFRIGQLVFGQPEFGREIDGIASVGMFGRTAQRAGISFEQRSPR